MANINAIIQVRNDIDANFKSSNIVLKKGEIAFESNTRRFKVGNGVDAYTALTYAGNIAVESEFAPTGTDVGYPIGTLWIHNNGTVAKLYVYYGISDNSGNAMWLGIMSPFEYSELRGQVNYNTDNIAKIETGIIVAGVAKKLQTARTISLTGDATGSTAFDGSVNKSITVTLKNSGATAGTYTKLTIDGKGIVTSATTLTEADIPTLHLSKIADAGTAASKNAGTAAGQVPVIGSDGKLADSLIPKIALTEPFVVATQTDMLALNAQIGDVAIRSDVKKTYILKQTPANTLANWLEMVSPTCDVISVNGKTGAVVISTTDVAEGNKLYYTEARATANFNSNFGTKSFKNLKDGAKLISTDDVLIINGGDAGGQ